MVFLKLFLELALPLSGSFASRSGCFLLLSLRTVCWRVCSALQIQCVYLRSNLIPLSQFAGVIGEDDHPFLLGRHGAGCDCESSARSGGSGDEGERS
jgi:hypothetical protein